MNARRPLRRPLLDPLSKIRFQRDCQRLHDLGPRALSEALLEIAGKIGGYPAICATLADYTRFSPELLRAVGGDRFVPRPLHLVPSDDDAEERRYEPAI
jgi:hypothetical protein